MDQRVKYKKEKIYTDLNWNTGRNVTNFRSMFSKREPMEETTRGKSHKSDFVKIKNKSLNERNPRAGMKWKDKQRLGKHSGQMVHGLRWGSSFANQEEEKKDDCSQRENFQREEQQKSNCKWPKWTLSKRRRREDVPNCCVGPGVRRASIWHRFALTHSGATFKCSRETAQKKKKRHWRKISDPSQEFCQPPSRQGGWCESPAGKSELCSVSRPHTVILGQNAS